MKFTRNIEPYIAQDLQSKMILMGGARQVGKTTLAQSFIKDPSKQYFNWDNFENRKQMRKQAFDPDLGCIILDEIHKYAKWRSVLKGLYDTYQSKLKILVTGSAKLDFFRKGGDSMFGRFFYYRLHPLSFNELQNNNIQNSLALLLKFGGFPEPLKVAIENRDSEQATTFHRRWQRERLHRVVYQDLNDLNKVKEISLLEVLIEALPDKVGSPLSVQSLSEDLSVAHATVQNWLELLEKVYYCFRVYPFGPSTIRAVKKAAKLYLWDWSEIENPGIRFENMMACQLLKYCHFIEDTQGHNMQLRYIRDVDGREIDFVVLKNKKPLLAVECKLKDQAISKHLYYFQERTQIESLYQVHMGQDHFIKKNISNIPFTDFCKKLNMP